MSVVLEWIKANPQAALGLGLYLASNIAVKLTAKPQTAGIGAFVLWLCDLVSIVPHKDAKGVLGALNLPGFTSKTDPSALPTPRGYVSVWLLAAIGYAGLLASCAITTNLAADVKSCAKSTLSSAETASWVQLQPAVNAALRQDWPAALVSLEQLALRYGGEFISCIVADLRAQYAGITGTQSPPMLHADRISAAEQAKANADAWLASHPVKP